MLKGFFLLEKGYYIRHFGDCFLDFDPNHYMSLIGKLAADPAEASRSALESSYFEGGKLLLEVEKKTVALLQSFLKSFHIKDLQA